MKEINFDKQAIAVHNSYNEKLIQERIQIKTQSFHEVHYWIAHTQDLVVLFFTGVRLDKEPNQVTTTKYITPPYTKEMWQRTKPEKPWIAHINLPLSYLNLQQIKI